MTIHGLAVTFAVCSLQFTFGRQPLVVCPLSSLLVLSLFYRYKGTELFQNGKHSKDNNCYFRKIEFLEQCAVRRFPRKKGDLHVVKDNDLLFFGTTKKRLAEATHCLFSFCVNFFPVTTVSSAPSRNFFKRDSDEISILQIKRANTLVNITYRYLRYIIISKYMYYSTYQ